MYDVILPRERGSVVAETSKLPAFNLSAHNLSYLFLLYTHIQDKTGD